MSSALAETTRGAEAVFLDLHKKFLANGRPEELVPIHQSAIERFDRLGFPHRKHEMYTFIHTKDLVSLPFQLVEDQQEVSPDFIRKHIYGGCENSHLTLVDGVFRSDLSNTTALEASVHINPLSLAVTRAEIKNYLTKALEQENDVFAALNGAFFKEGVVIDVIQNAQMETPVQILYVSTGSTAGPVMATPRVMVRMGPVSEMKLVVKYVGSGDNYFVNGVQDFILEEGAGVTYAQIQEDAKDAWHFSKNRVSLARNSWFRADQASSGNKLTRHHHEIHLNDLGAELQLNGVSVLVEEEQVHHLVRVHHEAPHCTSNQHFKNVINDRGRASVDGTVIVNKGAQLTSSDQLINNLMLSDSAHADAKPNLMIYADDVKCTHGATVGQIDEEQLFYLKARGLSQDLAKELLTRSFVESLIRTMVFPPVVEELNNTLLKKLEANNA